MTFYVEFGPESARICEMFAVAISALVHVFSVYVIVITVGAALRFMRGSPG